MKNNNDNPAGNGKRCNLDKESECRKYMYNGIVYVVDGRYTQPKNDGTDKTFADRIVDYIGSEFSDLLDAS